MRELNTIELNDVNGAFGLSTLTAPIVAHPYYALAAVAATVSLSVAAYFGWDYYLNNQSPINDAA